MVTKLSKILPLVLSGKFQSECDPLIIELFR
jgi:hypothetical protein